MAQSSRDAGSAPAGRSEGRVVRKLIPWVLGLGILARTLSYAANRSLWLDEAMIALNIQRRSWLDLIGTLDFNQAAPLGFLWLEKLAVLVLGANERALRLWPYVVAILSLFLLDAIARLLMRPAARLFSLTLFAVSGSLVYYAAEVKQYSFDVMLAALLIYVGLRQGIAVQRGSGSWRALAAAGAIGVWFSYPLVFILPGILAYLYWVSGPQSGRPQSGRPRSGRLRPLAGVALLWGASFVAAFLLTARGASQSPLMAQFWLEGFMPFPPTSLAQLQWFPGAFGGWIHNLLDYSETASPLRTVGISAGAGLALVGIARGWHRDRPVLTLLTVPILLALLASALHLYPFKGRLILFLLPSTAILLGWGLEAGLGGARRPGGDTGRRPGRIAGARIALAGAFALLFAAAVITGQWLRAPYREELRPVLVQMAERIEPGDVVYLHSGAQHAALFYERTCESCRLQSATLIRGAFLAGRDERIAADIARLPVTGRLWAVFSQGWWGYGDLERDRIVADLEGRAGPPEVITAPGAEAFLFDLSVRDPRWIALSRAVRGGRLREATDLGAALAAEAWGQGRIEDAHRAALQGAYLRLYGMGDVAGAIASAESTLVTWPPDRAGAASGLVLADFFGRAGQADRARALAEAWARSRGSPASEGASDIPRPRYERVRALLDMSTGDPGRAVARLREPLSRLDGCDACADFDLAVALDALSAVDSAIAVYGRYLDRELLGETSAVAFGAAHALRRLVALHAARGARLEARGDTSGAAQARERAREFAERLATLWSNADPEFKDRVAKPPDPTMGASPP